MFNSNYTNYGSILHCFDVYAVKNTAILRSDSDSWGHQDHRNCYHSIASVGYGLLLPSYNNFVSVMHLFEMFAFKKYSDLETRIRGHSS